MVTLKGEDKQRYVADLFSGIAGRYDLMNDLMTGGQHRRWKNETVRLATKDLPPNLPRLVLDVATGTGDLALATGKRPGVDRVIGVDLLPGMIRLARAKSITKGFYGAKGPYGARSPSGSKGLPGAKGLSGKVEFALGDALALPFPDGAFASCIAGFSLRNMPGTGGTEGIQSALAEMARVVHPGGRVVTLELTPMSKSHGAGLIQFYFHRVVPRMGHLVAGNRAAYTYLPQSVTNFPDADRLLTIFQGVGLSSVGFKTMGFGAVALHWGCKPTG